MASSSKQNCDRRPAWSSELCLLALALSLGVRAGGMRLVAAPFAVKIALAVASRGWRLTRTVLRDEALHRGPGGNLRAVEGKVLVRKQGTNLFVVEKLGQKLACHLGVQQP